MAQTPEGKVKARIDKLLQSYGADVWYAKMQTGGFGRSGVHDYICCVNGRFLSIEAKATPKHQMTALQRLESQGVEAAKGWFMLVHADNVDELKAVIDHLMSE